MNATQEPVFKDCKLVYALVDHAANTVVNYYVCDNVAWPSRYMRDLMENLRFGRPEEFTLQCVGGYYGLTHLDVVDLTVLASNAGVDNFLIYLHGGDYVDVLADNVQRNG